MNLLQDQFTRTRMRLATRAEERQKHQHVQINHTQNEMGGGVPWYHRLGVGSTSRRESMGSRQQARLVKTVTSHVLGGLVTLEQTDAATCPKLQQASLCVTYETMEAWLPGSLSTLSPASRALLRTLIPHLRPHWGFAPGSWVLVTRGKRVGRCVDESAFCVPDWVERRTCPWWSSPFWKGSAGR